MQQIYVQFTDASETTVGSVFACPQDPAVYPHQGVVANDDPRYLSFSGVGLPPTLATLKSSLLAAATAKRWDVETGGITLPNGARIATAKADQDRVTSVVVNAEAAGIETVSFKAESGWMVITVDEVKQIAARIAQHVQECFNAEHMHHMEIEALDTLAEAEAYDVSTLWP